MFLINYQKVKKLTKFSLIQLNTGCDPKKSFEVLKKYITKAARGGSKFVCTPETTNIMEVRNSLLFKKIYSEKEDIDASASVRSLGSFREESDGL